MNSQNLLQLIKERKSERMPFDGNRTIEPDALQSILEAAAYAPTAHNMQNFQIVVIDDKSVLSSLGELESSISLAFVQENFRVVSFSEDELRKRKTGMLASGFPPAWFTPEAREGKLDTSQFKGKLSWMLNQVPVLMLIVYDPDCRAPGSEGDFLGVMSLGFMLENVWLMASSQGIGLRVISAFGDEPLESEVKKMLGIPSSLRIALGCCLGYPSVDGTGEARVHRDVEDFVFFNRYQA